jgi:hypothetical protein
MAKFDVHVRMPVRIKFRDVEAASAVEALKTVVGDSERMSLAERTIQREFGSGLIEHIELDECAPTSGLVDLVGDEQHENTVDFEFDGNGDPYPYDHAGRIAVCGIERIAHEAAGTTAPTDADGRSATPVAAVIQTIFGSISKDEAAEALSDMDDAIRILTLARDAVAATIGE